MIYSKRFKDFVEQCDQLDQFVGFGNPSADILIIGKEVSTDTESNKALEKQNAKRIEANAKDWQKNIQDNVDFDEIKNWRFDKDLQVSDIDNNPLFPWKGTIKKKTSDTFKKYQKLHDIIFSSKFDTDNSKEVNFFKNFFITEMNQIASPTTRNAKRKDNFKENLRYRKYNIINSGYIRQFPVVILACSHYIINSKSTREIDDIFGVTFDGHSKGKFHFSKANWFFTHHDEDRSNLVIHTRQLSNNVRNDLLKRMGEVIRQHLS